MAKETLKTHKIIFDKKGQALGTKRRSSSKKAKLPPAARYLRYEMTNSISPGVETSHYIDLARDLSAVNRRLYRQGRDYHVKKITIVSSNTPNLGNRISVSTLPDTWVTRNAWKRGFETWNRMNKEAMHATSDSVKGTWSDFKVYLSVDSEQVVGRRPVDNGGGFYSLGEWDYSKFVTPDGTTGADEFKVWMLGAHSGTPGAWVGISLIKSYAESRATVQEGSPNIPTELSDDPLINVFDYGTTVDEVLDNIEEFNDFPPYDVGKYPGETGNGPKPLIAQDGTIVDGRCTLGGFNAICGLLEFETKSLEAGDVFSVLVELAPGGYRGIKAEVI